MEAFIEQVYSILINPPGNLAFFVILSFTVVGALQSSLNHWRLSGFPQGNRMVAGLTALLIFQLGQFAVAGLAWQGLIDPHTWLPPIDRMVMLLSMVCIVWLWLVPEPRRLADAAFIFIFAAVIVFSSLTLVWWNSQPPDLTYNATWADWGASMFGLGIISIGLLGLMIRRPNGWGIGTTMLVLLFAGLLLEVLYPDLGANYAAPVRLAQLMAYPWLLALPQRFPIPIEDAAPAPQAVVAERRRYSTDIQSLLDFASLFGETPIAEQCSVITRTLSHIMLADYCLLVSPPGVDDTLTIVCGFNLIEEKSLEGFSLESRQIPTVASALKRGKSLRLPASSTSTDLHSLANGLRMSRVGHLLAVPILSPDRSPALGLILLSPFSNRGWGKEDQESLEQISVYLAKILNPADKGEGITAAQTEAGGGETELLKLEQELQEAKEALEKERSRSASLAAVVAGLQAVDLSYPDEGLDSQTVKDGELAGSEIENGDNQVSFQAYQDLQANLRLALEQVADLRSELEKVLIEKEPPAPTTPAGEPILSFEEALAEVPGLLELEKAEQQPRKGIDHKEEVADIVQELRQPMASIMGYTDLLLGESVGIIGALQRKFLERIRVSVERLGGLADDLIQLTEFSEKQDPINREQVYLDHLIDNAVSRVKFEIERKNIDLEMNIPEKLPALYADQDALQKVLDTLLQNASDCTPEQGTIQVKVIVELKDHEPGFILIQVADSGEGLSASALPRVFSSIYTPTPATPTEIKNEKVDLLAAKGLVEAHGGRIWVDSIVGKGSTFSTLLPLEPGLEG